MTLACLVVVLVVVVVVLLLMLLVVLAGYCAGGRTFPVGGPTVAGGAAMTATAAVPAGTCGRSQNPSKQTSTGGFIRTESQKVAKSIAF